MRDTLILTPGSVLTNTANTAVKAALSVGNRVSVSHGNLNPNLSADTAKNIRESA